MIKTHLLIQIYSHTIDVCDPKCTSYFYHVCFLMPSIFLCSHSIHLLLHLFFITSFITEYLRHECPFSWFCVLLGYSHTIIMLCSSVLYLLSLSLSVSCSILSFSFMPVFLDFLPFSNLYVSWKIIKYFCVG
jgi:hypothetical protein